jgi:hypothetical protein
MMLSVTNPQKLFEATIESRNNDKKLVELNTIVRALQNDLFVLECNMHGLERENLRLKGRTRRPVSEGI